MRTSVLRLGTGVVALLGSIMGAPIVDGGARDVASGEGAWIGVALSPLSDDLRAAWSYQGAGLLVSGIEPGGPASRAGIQLGDLLVVVGSVALRSEEDLVKARARLEPDERVSVVVARNEGRLIKIVNLEAFGLAAPEPEAPAPEAPAPTGREVAVASASSDVTVQPAIVQDPVAELGVEGADLNSGLASALSVPMNKGVLVLRVESGSPADRVGVRPGDVIVRLGDQVIEDLDQFGKELKVGFTAIALRLQRQKTSREVQVSLESPPTPGKAEKATELETAANAEIDALRRELVKLRAEVAASKSQ